MPIRTLRKPILLSSRLLSRSNSLSLASVSQAGTPFAIRKSRTFEDSSPQIILALASVMTLSAIMALPNGLAQAGRAAGARRPARRNPALPEAHGSRSDDQIL